MSGDLGNGFGGQGPPHDAAGSRAEKAGDAHAAKLAAVKRAEITRVFIAAEDTEGRA